MSSIYKTNKDSGQWLMSIMMMSIAFIAMIFLIILKLPQRHKAAVVATPNGVQSNPSNVIQDKIVALDLTPISDFANWKTVAPGWQIRGIYIRRMKDDNENLVFCEYSIRRSDNIRPKLTRILIELFDKHQKPLIPSLVDISGTDSGLSYVRTGAYNKLVATPEYCRVAISDVYLAEYHNGYPRN